MPDRLPIVGRVPRRWSVFVAARRAGALFVMLSLLILSGCSLSAKAARRPECPLPPPPGSGDSGSARPSLCWALIGNSETHLAQEYEAGIRYKVFELDWANYTPESGVVDDAYVHTKHVELSSLQNVGFGVILSLGLQNPPRWIHDRYADSYYVNQYGEPYIDDVDGGDVNLVFNPALRDLAAGYIQAVFREFGRDFAGVRLGFGRYGELTYPPAEYIGRSNCYWSFDKIALTSSPTPNWRPGQAARSGEARQFVEWYLNQLVDFEHWQIVAVRATGYSGPLMMLYPSWGIRPGDLDRAVKGELMGLSPAEQNGEIQRGYDFARQMHAIRDPGVVVTTTWLDADASGDAGTDPHAWSPAKYLASLAHAHPLHLAVFGENTGQGSPAAMQLSASQVLANGLGGMAWLNESQLFSGDYATLDDYQRAITTYSPGS